MLGALARPAWEARLLILCRVRKPCSHTKPPTQENTQDILFPLAFSYEYVHGWSSNCPQGGDLLIPPPLTVDVLQPIHRW